jgi:glucosamine--fructose-6-phosphate aminotransferase (isomerizing)
VTSSVPSRSPDPPQPGELFLAEIREQPEALLRLLEHGAEFDAVGRLLAARAPSVVRLIGHGSSDNAAVYAVYAFGLLPGWTALRDSISLTVYYDAQLDLSSSAVVALSQSGQTRDVVEYVNRARARGALTIGLTNEPGSGLGTAAEIVLPLAAGPERAVAATKTYVNQLAALALLAGAAAGRGRELSDWLRRAAELLAGAVDPLERAVSAATIPFSYVGRMFVVGRGLEFATAREIALKLTETCQIAAEPLTATALAHGPVAVLDSLFPVWTIASRDKALPAVIEAAAKVREAGGTLVASGSAAGEVAGADYVLAVPEAPAPLVAPVLSVLPGQLFAAALARAKGLDPDRPPRLSKITLAS